MDLGTIQHHLDNFATTWSNWGKLFENINTFYNSIAGDKEGETTDKLLSPLKDLSSTLEGSSFGSSKSEAK